MPLVEQRPSPKAREQPGVARQRREQRQRRAPGGMIRSNAAWMSSENGGLAGAIRADTANSMRYRFCSIA